MDNISLWIYIFVYVYRSICMHTCTCVCGYACTSVCAYEGQISASGVFLNNCFIFLRQNLFRKFKSLSWPEELFSDLQLTAPCLQDQNYRCSPHALRFTHGFWAPEVRSLHFMVSTLYVYPTLQTQYILALVPQTSFVKSYLHP